MKKKGKKKYAWLILVLPMLVLVGCGNTIKSSIKAGKCALDVPVAVYQDVKENALIVKDEFEHPAGPIQH